MKAKISSFFPATRGRWIQYTKTSVPVILAAMIFALNNFIDNFTAIKIPGGNQALSYANSWTSLVTGIIATTGLVGSALFGQYLGTEDRKKIREVVRARTVIALGIALVFAIPALIAPEFMTDLISGFDKQIPANIYASTNMYTRWISLSWLLTAWAYINAMTLRESGHGSVSLISSCISLVSNVVLNVAFIFGIAEQIEFLAYTTILSQIISITFMTTFIWLKDKRIIINPLKLFAVSGKIWKQFLKRINSFILLTVGSTAISIRFIFWNNGYPTGSIGSVDSKLSAATILGISGMFFNVFWTAFESLNANVAIFVGKELGNNNIKQAKINAKELQGFHLCIAFLMGTLLFSLSLATEQMSFLTYGYQSSLQESLASGGTLSPAQISQIVNQGSAEFLANLKITLWPLAWNMPIWMWFLTKKIIIASGGLTNITSLIDTLAGIVQTTWIIIINLVIAKNFALAFPWAYALFFVSDVIKLPVFETLYYKANWARNVTIETETTEVEMT